MSRGRGADSLGAPSYPYSPECVEGVFSEVGLSLLLRVCGLLFLHDLKPLDHLEGEAHYATLLTLVLNVDGLVVVVDEYLVEDPLVVVEALGPLRDGLVLYIARLLGHRRLLLPSIVCSTPKRLNVSHRGAFRVLIQRSAWKGYSTNF